MRDLNCAINITQQNNKQSRSEIYDNLQTVEGHLFDQGFRGNIVLPKANYLGHPMSVIQLSTSKQRWNQSDYCAVDVANWPNAQTVRRKTAHMLGADKRAAQRMSADYICTRPSLLRRDEGLRSPASQDCR